MDDNDIPLATTLDDPHIAQMSARGAALLRQSLSGDGVKVAQALASPDSIRFELPVSQKLFEMYDRAGEWLASCRQVQGSISDLTLRIAKLEEELALKKQILQEGREEEVTLQRRISRNENPHFLHYLQYDRKGKVDRLKLAERDLATVDERVEERVYELERELAPLKEDRALLIMRDRFERGRKNTFDRVAPPSRHVQQIRETQNQKRRQLTDGRSLENGLIELQIAAGYIDQASNLLHRWEVESTIELAKKSYMRMKDAFTSELWERYTNEASEICIVLFPETPGGERHRSDDIQWIAKAKNVVSEASRLIRLLQQKIDSDNLVILNEIEGLEVQANQEMDAIFLRMRQQYSN